MTGHTVVRMAATCGSRPTPRSRSRDGVVTVPVPVRLRPFQGVEVARFAYGAHAILRDHEGFWHARAVDVDAREALTPLAVYKEDRLRYATDMPWSLVRAIMPDCTWEDVRRFGADHDLPLRQHGRGGEGMALPRIEDLEPAGIVREPVVPAPAVVLLEDGVRVHGGCVVARIPTPTLDVSISSLDGRSPKITFACSTKRALEPPPERGVNPDVHVLSMPLECAAGLTDRLPPAAERRLDRIVEVLPAWTSVPHPHHRRLGPTARGAVVRHALAGLHSMPSGVVARWAREVDDVVGADDAVGTEALVRAFRWLVDGWDFAEATNPVARRVAHWETILSTWWEAVAPMADPTHTLDALDVV